MPFKNATAVVKDSMRTDTAMHGHWVDLPTGMPKRSVGVLKLLGKELKMLKFVGDEEEKIPAE